MKQTLANLIQWLTRRIEQLSQALSRNAGPDSKAPQIVYTIPRLLLSKREAAESLGMTSEQFDEARHGDKERPGIPFVSIGDTQRYRVQDLLEWGQLMTWLSEHERTGTIGFQANPEAREAAISRHTAG